MKTNLNRLAKISRCLVLGIATVCAMDHSASDYILRPIAEGFTSPIGLVPFENGAGKMVVVDQIGKLTVIDGGGEANKELFLDLRDRLVKLNENAFDERGALGLAFHPKFNENRKVYVHYSAPLREGAPSDWNHTSHISEFQVFENNREKVDPSTERVVMKIDQPYFNHNGGPLAFGPDGFLYIAVGDGGNANDVGIGHPPQGNGQDTSTLLGAILRIDADSEQPYGVPKDNPFVGKEGRPEIYAYGLRNPWGISFDRGGERQFFAADVGQTMYEEVNLIQKGGNYGWNIREGTHCFDPKDPRQPPEECAKVGARGEPLLDPIIEYRNANGFRRDDTAIGICVVGGYVYRGKIPELQGKYIFADWSRNWAVASGVLLQAAPPGGGGGSWTVEPLEIREKEKGQIGLYVMSMGQDAAGEIYVLTSNFNSLLAATGKVFKLVAE